LDAAVGLWVGAKGAKERPGASPGPDLNKRLGS